MPFRPAPNSQLTIRNRKFTVCEHPTAPRMPYGQSGRRALVYQLRDQNGRQFALKVFRETFRSAEIEQSAKNLQNYASLPGLGVCQRWVLTDTHDATLLQQYPDLRYAALMTWIQGLTWQEVILARTDFNPRQSYQFANGLVNILAGMERSGVAHCDLSGANVLLPGLADQHPPVALVDVEEMYIPGTQGPTTRPAGSLGYNHPSTASGLWSADVDRFAGAVLIAEILGWFDPDVRQAALTGTDGSPGEQYFAADEIQQPCPRFDMLYHSLETRWSANMAALLARAWSSATLSSCPRFAEWQDGFPTLMTRLAQFEEMSLPKKDVGYQVRWSKVPNVAAPDLLVGGRYRILQLFSDGGFGLVYLAIDTRDNSQCVLKKNKDTSEESRRQFAREAHLLQRLDHRNLVKVLDYLDLPNDGQYIVMEFVQGDDLQTIMTRHGPTHFNWALPYIEQICDALSYLHAQNPPIIHRDIKPANIRITSDKRVVLIDFGIAKITGETSATTLGARAVSPGFSPPEQYGQNSTNIRSDVYALGATVWALLAGQTPQVSVDRIKHDSMFPLSGLPPHIEATLQRALDLNPMRRFASVHEFWFALSVAPEPKPVFPPYPVQSVLTQRKRKISTPFFAFIFAMLLPCLVVSGIAIYLWGQLTPAPAPILTPLTPDEVAAMTVTLTNTQTPHLIEFTVTTTLLPVFITPTQTATLSPTPTQTATLSPTPTQTTTLSPTPLPVTVTIPVHTDQILIPAGDFMMGANSDPERGRYDTDEGPTHLVYLSEYWIDKMEVTIVQFQQFVNQTGYITTAERNGYGYAYNRGTITSSSTIWVKVSGASWRDPFGNGQLSPESLPVTQVSFYDAESYCNWMNRSLPTEAEWEKAARGIDQRRYPWGNAAPSIQFLRSMQNFGSGPLPVGSYPAGQSPYGVFDMAGNVWEWTSDNYSKTYYSESPYENPTGPVGGDVKVMRGGGWHRLGGQPHHVRAVNRDVAQIDSYNDTLGFRCVSAFATQTISMTFTSSSTLYKVHNVKSDDILNIRSGPGIKYQIIGELPYDGVGITLIGENTDADNATWVKVIYRGITGWVNNYYIKKQ